MRLVGRDAQLSALHADSVCHCARVAIKPATRCASPAHLRTSANANASKRHCMNPKTSIATWFARTYVSPVIEAMTGFQPDELLGRNQAEFVHAEDWPQVADLSRRAIGAHRYQPTEFRMRTKPGGWLWVRSSGRPIMLAAG